jgi:hypothetical protein
MYFTFFLASRHCLHFQRFSFSLPSPSEALSASSKLRVGKATAGPRRRGSIKTAIWWEQRCDVDWMLKRVKAKIGAMRWLSADAHGASRQKAGKSGKQWRNHFACACATKIALSPRDLVSPLSFLITHFYCRLQSALPRTSPVLPSFEVDRIAPHQYTVYVAWRDVDLFSIVLCEKLPNSSFETCIYRR